MYLLKMLKYSVKRKLILKDDILGWKTRLTMGFSTIHGLGSLGSLGSQHHQYLLGSQDELGSHRFQKACWKQWEPSSFWEPSRY